MFYSSLKKKIGGKGISSIAYLSIFNNVSIKSFLKEDNLKVSFNFTDTFKYADVRRETAQTPFPHNLTEIEFQNIRTEYKYDIKALKEKLLIHLLPLLYRMKEKGKLQINFIDENHPLGTLYINSDTLPTLNATEFEIKETETPQENPLQFVLYSAFLNSPDPKGIFDTYYCADSRTVCHFNDKEFNRDPVPYKRIILLLTSPFFDERLNDERNDFLIRNGRDSDECDFDEEFDWKSSTSSSWQEINEYVLKHLSPMFYRNFPPLPSQEFNNKKMQEFTPRNNIIMFDSFIKRKKRAV